MWYVRFYVTTGNHRHRSDLSSRPDRQIRPSLVLRRFPR
jgi:hypothetical protein